jgi:hypothetical protein
MNLEKIFGGKQSWSISRYFLTIRPKRPRTSRETGDYFKSSIVSSIRLKTSSSFLQYLAILFPCIGFRLPVKLFSGTSEFGGAEFPSKYGPHTEKSNMHTQKQSEK